MGVYQPEKTTAWLTTARLIARVMDLIARTVLFRRWHLLL
jgi:hypothetical protein